MRRAERDLPDHRRQAVRLRAFEIPGCPADAVDTTQRNGWLLAVDSVVTRVTVRAAIGEAPQTHLRHIK